MTNRMIKCYWLKSDQKRIQDISNEHPEIMENEKLRDGFLKKYWWKPYLIVCIYANGDLWIKRSNEFSKTLLSLNGHQLKQIGVSFRGHFLSKRKGPKGE